MAVIIVTNCGASSTPRVLDAAKKACEVGFKILKKNGKAIDAVEEAVVVLEDDERLNAGTGSRLRLSGKVQMDASLMDSRKNCGCVAAIEDVKNPIRVAREVMKTPHILLAGKYATKFARKRGFEHYDPRTKRTIELLEKAKRRLKEKELPPWAGKWKKYRFTETVGAVAMDSKGRFAAGNSTGGHTFMLDGRVGDTPIVGAGLYAARRGAVVATGIGEEIMKVVLSKWIYDRIEEGQHPQDACDSSLSFFKKDVPTGVLALSKDGYGVSCNTRMAWWAQEE